MELKSGYKQTDVGVIPEDWEVKTLADVGSWKGGATPSMHNPSFWSNGTVPWASSGDLKAVLLSDTPMKITDSAVRESSTTLLPANSIMIVTRSGILRRYLPVSMNTRPFAINQDIKALVPSPEAVPEYLLYLLIGNGRRILGSCLKSGTTVESIEFPWLKGFRVPFPPTKAEQEAIAETLSDADALTESLEQLVAKKRHVKQGAMRELLRPKDGWVRKMLGELATIQRGASPRPIDSPVWFNENSTVGWVRISDVTRASMFLRETSQRLSPLGIQNSRPVSRGSLIMSICATVGRPIITEIDTCIHDGFVVFDSLRANKYFLYYVLKSIEGDWAKRGQTGSQMNLNTGLINQKEVATPKTARQQEEIANVLMTMDSELTALEAKLAKARQIKQGMMLSLLTGRIRLV